MKGTVLAEMALVMDERDNVATALDDVAANTTITYSDTEDTGKPEQITIVEDVAFGHKFALMTIAEGEDVYKYGEVIGETSQRIEQGKWVHTHNCDSKRGRGDVAAEASENKA